MYNGIGLQTPRGSGTNGYIQSNKFFVKPKSNKVVVDADAGKGFEPGQGTAGVTRKPNMDILEHDRKRQIQVKLVELEDKLIYQGYTDAEIAVKLDEARRTLEAASACEEAGGAKTIVVGDKKVSDTQTHQIAARKEKQMEALKSALGIGSELGDQKKLSDAPYLDSEESNDDDKPRNRQKNGGSDDRKWHDKDTKDESNEMRKGVKNKKNEGGRDGIDDSKRHKKKESRRRRDEDSSDADSSEKRVKGTRKKHHKSYQESDNDDDSDVGKKSKKSSRKHKKSRRHDTDDSDSDEIYEKAHKRRGSDDDNCSSDEFSNHKPQKVKQHSKRSRRHDSEDDSDADSWEEDRRNQIERNRSQQSRSYLTENVDYVSNDHRKISNERREKGGRRYDVKGESGSDKETKHEKEKVEKSWRRGHDTDKGESDTNYDEKIDKSRRSRRRDSDEDGSDDSKSDDSQERSSRSDSGSDISDYRHEKIDRIKSLEKRQRDRGNDSSGRGGQSGRGTSLEQKGGAVENELGRKEKHGLRNEDNGLDALRKLEELYQSRRDTAGRSGYESRDIRGKRKFNHENQDEQPLDAKSRSRELGKEAEDRRDLKKDTRIESEANSRSYRNKEDQKSGDYSRLSRFGGEHESENFEDVSRLHSQVEVNHESRRNDRDYEEHGGGRRRTRIEDRRGRKHKRDEEDEIGWKHEKSEEHRGRRHGRELEEHHESRWHERDRQVDSSKRVRYDSLSNERRYDNYKRDDGQARRRD